MESPDRRRALLLPVVCMASFLLMSLTVADAGTLKQVRVDEYGHNDWNTIQSPIYVAEGAAALRVGTLTASYDPKAKIVRGKGNLFTKGPSLDLHDKVNLADLFAGSLRAEAKAMGYPLAAAEPSAGGWTVSGDLKDVYIESWQITGYGSILFYGFMDLELEIQGPSGVAETRRYRVHSFHEEPGGGFSRTGRSEAALATLFVTGAQETISRLNREFFKASISRDIDETVEALVASGVEHHEAGFHRIGLAGTPKVVAALLAQLPKEQDSDNRIVVIDALARAGSSDAVEPLIQLYAEADEQCRWYTLKAMDYIGGDKAVALIRDKGAKDDDYSVKSLATRVAGAQ